MLLKKDKIKISTILRDLFQDYSSILREINLLKSKHMIEQKSAEIHNSIQKINGVKKELDYLEKEEEKIFKKITKNMNLLSKFY